MIKINDRVLEINKFPDDTPLLNVNPIYYEISERATITWHYANNEELVVLAFLSEHLRNCGVKHLCLEMPYIPNARQDRVKHTWDVFTLKYFANLINYLKFDEVVVLDPHSVVSEALLNNLTVVSAKSYIELAAIQCKPDLLFFPDEGAMKRYSGRLKTKYAFGIKDRDWETGKIKGLSVAGNVDEIKGSRILIVDDICSRGGTFYHSAKKLKELGAEEVYLYITHCENTILDGDLLSSGLIEKVYTTDSIFTKEHEKIEVIKL